jgi:cyanate permease
VLILQREFAASSFGLALGLTTAIGQFLYAFGPSLVGIVRDAAGGYGPAVGLCAVLDVMAAIVVLLPRVRARARSL